MKTCTFCQATLETPLDEYGPSYAPVCQTCWLDPDGVACSVCEDGQISCSACDGLGYVYPPMPGIQDDDEDDTECEDCGGRGFFTCSRCNGRYIFTAQDLYRMRPSELAELSMLLTKNAGDRIPFNQTLFPELTHP